MVLLDTCAAIWLANGDTMSSQSLAAIRSATARGDVLVSPVSAWEIGLLATRRGVTFRPSPRDWFDGLLARPGVRLVPLTIGPAIDASFLPPPVNGDPADRLLIATARHLQVPVVTRDSRILAYAANGHVGAIAC